MEDLENLIVDLYLPIDSIILLLNYMEDEGLEDNLEYKYRCINLALQCLAKKIKTLCLEYQNVVEDYYAQKLSAD